MTNATTRRATLLGALALLAPAAAHAQDRFFVHIAQTPTTDVAARPDGDVLEVAAAAGQFQTFLRAAEVAGYRETLRGEGPFTIFAPTDTAFRSMGERELSRLLRPASHEELLALLAYHVVPGRLTSANMQGRVARAEAASGYRLQIDGRDGLRVNDQLVVMPDLEARNGVIQSVNTVLTPPVLVASR
ncbi:fasciclin domain-containing protein [Terricaulis sp.]|uniref:fasciclin domain-containing protein n=1 Tax=Terricaulis sp. TaxID=2768686 RepID=UPI003784AD13